MVKIAKKKSTILSYIAIILLVVALVVVAYALREKESLKTPTTNTTYAMGTVISQSYYCADKGVGDQTVIEITKIINTLDEQISWRKEKSEIASINENATGYVNKVVYDCVEKCCEISKDCNGALDITVGKLSGIWNIGTEDARVPSEEEIITAIDTIGYEGIVLTKTENDYSIDIGANQRLDLGAVGKGLACDEALKYLNNTTIKGATVSVGGSILVYGENPTSSDGTWNIGVRDPFGTESDYMAVVNTEGGFFSTSGDYEKVLEVDGKKYHHILDPKTGYPAESNITGVTIYSKDSGLVTDALSTACFILGYSEDSLKLLDKYNAEAIFIMKDKTVKITDGLKDKVTIVNDEFEVAQ